MISSYQPLKHFHRAVGRAITRDLTRDMTRYLIFLPGISRPA